MKILEQEMVRTKASVYKSMKLKWFKALLKVKQDNDLTKHVTYGSDMMVGDSINGRIENKFCYFRVNNEQKRIVVYDS